MYRLIKSILLQLLFWLLFFAMGRIIFLLFHLQFIRAEQAPLTEVLSLFFHALRLDIATACYILVIPFFLQVASLFTKEKLVSTLNYTYTLLIIIIFSLIVTGEIGVYAEWKTKLDYKALLYLKHPGEVAQSTPIAQTILLIFLLITQVLLATFAYKRWFWRQGAGSWSEKREAGSKGQEAGSKRQEAGSKGQEAGSKRQEAGGRRQHASRHPLPATRHPLPASRLLLPATCLLIPALLFLGIRGGIQQIPISQSESYYSKHNILNIIAVNAGFNLYKSYIQNRDFMKENPFAFYPLKEAQERVKQLHAVEKDTTVSILRVAKPNIVLLLLESWSGDLIQSLGGEAGITPQFRELEKDGLLFTNLYASGNRSQQAMAAVFGGFPSIPVTAITHNSNKFIKLPSLSKELNKAGYHTSYYFGGQLIYGELRAYIMFNEFNRIVEGKDFDASLPRGALGVHDQYLFTRQLSDLNKEKQPFFSAAFTLSSHSPYDEPMEKVLHWGGSENDFINSAYYTDKCLGDFFREARKQPWYANTLFVLVADHSHNSYRNWGVNTPPYRKIPLLLYGEALKEKYRGKQIARVSSQTDIATTLLKQLNLSAENFQWSKDLFNPYTPEFAYFEINVGCGWIRPDGQFVYQNTTQSFDQNTFPAPVKEERVKEGKSYLQVLFQQFMDY
jgi:hypothetical protein